jgi:hypothetical protein
LRGLATREVTARETTALEMAAGTEVRTASQIPTGKTALATIIKMVATTIGPANIANVISILQLRERQRP